MAVIDFLDQGWRRNPDGAAYVMDGVAYSFSEMRALSSRIANALRAHALPLETKVAVWSLNDPVAWGCVLGAWRAGLTWVPVNPRSSQDENAHVLAAFDCEVLFYQSQFADVVDAIAANLPKLKLRICLDGAPAGAVALEGFTAGQPDNPPDIPDDPDRVVMLGATGGTTGLPKGVMNTNRNIQTFFAQYAMAAAYRADEFPVNLAAAPMTHTAGILSLPTTARGGTVVVMSKADPAGIVDAIETHRVSELFLPPTVIYMLLNLPEIAARDTSSLRYFLYGAAPMSVEKLREAIEVLGPVMMEGYGQMEAFASISYLRPEEHFVDGRIAPDARLASCGRPLPLTRVTIRDDANREVATGEPGEICVRGDIVMKGYYRNPEKTAETIVDGWLHTGDIGHLDAEGFLYITDRKKDMIITGGFNVFPSEVEQVIWGHPAVQDCAVIGVPDQKWGEAVKAVVECKAGASVAGEELIALCRGKLGGVKTPKSVDFVDELPRSANGKVLKKKVRASYWDDTERSI